MDSGVALYEKLLAQCKLNDVDAKVDALTKLQAQFEQGGIEVPDSEALIGILKASLRTSNLHLTNATLSTLSVILPALISRPTATQLPTSIPAPTASTSSVSPANIDIATLRLALSSFLTAGGIIDRLGDKERAQAKARESLVILGGYAFRASPATTALAAKAGKGQEPPVAVFERFLKEGGLASKVWKVREQSILTLVHIRRAHHLFPIRPYSSLLVDCLEDTDPHVRDCARTSVVELFTGPGVSDAARADLKKEMTKKGVRKAIVDGVLAKLLSAPAGNNAESHEGSENGDVPFGKKEYVPPSLVLQGKRPRVASQNTTGSNRTVSQPIPISRPASRAATSPPPPQTPASSDSSSEIRPVYIASSKDLENEFAAMAKPFEGKETEHNWSTREQSIQRVRGMLKGEVHIRYPEPFFLALKEGFIQWSLKTLASLRTTVAINTCLLYSELAQALGSQLDPHVDILMTNLLKMAGFTKKLTAQQSQATISTIITNTSAQPRTIIPLLWNASQEKTVQARAYVVGHFKLYLEHHGHRAKNGIEGSGLVETLEKALKKALADPNPAAREQARILFWVFEDIWPDRGIAILDTLESVTRKQVEKACPNPNAQSLPPTTPQVSKKSSVAAAIAASRAKAKAIATAPPSLRHQATSASHVGAPRRAGSPSLSPKNSTVQRPASPLRSSTAPSSPSSRLVASGGFARSTSITNAPSTSHNRTNSDGSLKRERSPSPAPSDPAVKRRLSSPLAGTSTSSTMRKALATALPPSPPSQATPTPRRSFRNNAVPLPPRQSLSQVFNKEDSLLMAQSVPIPDDTDSEDDKSINLMSFSTPFNQTQINPKSKGTLSPVSDSLPPASVSNALSSGSLSDMADSQQFVVEDALRARAEQAESAAERLLELVEPEDESTPQRPKLPALLMKTPNGHPQATPKPKLRPAPLPATRPQAVPVTPNNRASKVMKQAAMFMDSPAPPRNGRSSNLLDVLQSQTQQTGWWLKRNALHAKANFAKSDVASTRVALDELISALDSGHADIEVLKRLALICVENSTSDAPSPVLSSDSKLPGSPTPLDPLRTANLHLLDSSIWEKDKTFEKFFQALMKYLEPTRDEEELLYGLIVTWEVLENQTSYLDGKEGELFTMILQVRYCNKINVLEGTNAIRDALTSKVDPVYGLTTIHSSLKLFQAEAPPFSEYMDIKAASYAFGLMALGKFILRLPAEIAEEELPRLKATFITALNDRSSLIVRESAAAAIIAAQFVLRDETHLFTLLDGLADEKKNLLTYLFDKHGARGSETGQGSTGIDKLEKEIRRLDTRTSTPMRGGI